MVLPFSYGFSYGKPNEKPPFFIGFNQLNPPSWDLGGHFGSSRGGSCGGDVDDLRPDSPSWRMRILQCEAPKIPKLVYNSNNYGLWYANNYRNNYEYFLGDIDTRI